MNVLLDTHVFIWLDMCLWLVPDPVRTLMEDSENRIFLSSISVWEIFQKHKSGKLVLTRSADRFIREGKEKYDIESLPFSEESVLHLDKLPLLHGDPFDRMLICQAIQHGMSLVTGDRHMQQYPVKTLW